MTRESNVNVSDDAVLLDKTLEKTFTFVSEYNSNVALPLEKLVTVIAMPIVCVFILSMYSLIFVKLLALIEKANEFVPFENVGAFSVNVTLSNGLVTESFLHPLNVIIKIPATHKKKILANFISHSAFMSCRTWSGIHYFSVIKSYNHFTCDNRFGPAAITSSEQPFSNSLKFSTNRAASASYFFQYSSLLPQEFSGYKTSSGTSGQLMGTS